MKKTSFVILFTVMFLPLMGCSTPLKRFTYQQPHMGTKFNIVLYAPDEITANKAASEAYTRIAELNQMMSDYIADSELNQLSATSGNQHFTKVSPELFYILRESITLSQATDGAFDITVGPAVKLWRRARRQHQYPDADRLEQAKKAVDYRYITLNLNTKAAHLKAPGMKLDLGGIAKGFACDVALSTLKKHGISRALIDGGGDMVLGDPPPDRDGWRIELRPLGNNQNELPQNLRLPEYLVASNLAVATSGDAFQSVTLNGKRYSHIIDPRTCIALTTRVAVTVIAPNGTTADSLASALSVLGPEEGLSFIAGKPKVAALIVEQPEDDLIVIHPSRTFEKLNIEYTNDAPAETD